MKDSSHALVSETSRYRVMEVVVVIILGDSERSG